MKCKCKDKVIIKYLDTYPHELKPALEGDAGIDIYASKIVAVRPFETVLIPTGLYMEIPKGYYCRLVGRSSLHKQGLHVNEGIIDSGYRGEVKVSMTNSSNETIFARLVEAGERVAQLIISKVEPVEFIAVDELSDSERGSNGFGHTGR